ncbi:hypothetical protein TRFO_12536 [Tritrichomonas foetus]|uniref:USP domain-containing protein n=1 Tax=Tritrichomonas foetus TaxID=1144522 RepID=A0A1J4KXX0_9EUKA|nr:hypothetical protein TRFO_38442 [Tritrichomonas foetus]OHS99200.1 hypothetical protein TRFO_34366 [Tritrichomonas foetus]OHT00482.1 hypothetical protein TRFO_32792 [Tritrichomonas foetus]OHT06286.1 hypothetical protein TRFO_25696 [Tritrichomonas foetus]OHT08315.1 hypothetical protein TRFO_04931 [Tritrichomonas foetus]|eukprot:OHS95461.1 hypothetical protein TRFO_38442 [Tritrichomonas foetus]
MLGHKIGIRNLGNTCFAASVLQLMLNITKFNKTLQQLEYKDEEGKQILKFFSHTENFQKEDLEALLVTGMKFVENINQIEQKDAHEFLLKFLESINEHCRDPNCSDLYNLFLIEKQIITYYSNGTDEEENISNEKFIFENVSPEIGDLQKHINSIAEAPHVLISDAPERISQSIRIIKSPSVLLFMIRRVEIDGDNAQRNTTPVKYSPEIMYHGKQYRLYGVINHNTNQITDPQWGHYITHCYEFATSKVYTFNDSLVIEDQPNVLYIGQGNMTPQTLAYIVAYISQDEIDSLFSASEGSNNQNGIQYVAPEVNSCIQQVNFLDSRQEDALETFIRNAPNPESTQATRIASQDLNDLSTPIILSFPESTSPTEESASQEKRAYQKTTNDARRLLTKLYQVNGDKKTPLEYSAESGIKLGNCKKLLYQLKKGESIEIKQYKRGRKSKITPHFAQLIHDELEEHSTESLREVARQIALQNDSTSNDQIPSYSSIYRYATSHRIADDFGCNVYSFKVASIRGPSSNAESNKDLRIERIKLLNHYITEGFVWSAVDEVSIEIGTIRRRAWSQKGEKAFINVKPQAYRCSAIASISNNGMSYCLLVPGTVNGELFQAFMKYLINSLQKQGNIVFWMDNAKIHSRIENIVQKGNHVAIYNAAYSPELNPIELIFGHWKSIIKREVKDWSNEMDLYQKIANCFNHIDPTEIRKVMTHVSTKVFAKVLNRENI